MFQAAVRLPYAKRPGLQAVDLPYKGKRLSMLILLPGRGRLGALERGLTARRLATITASLTPRTVDLSMPRFTISTRLSLAPVLGALGMPRAFTDQAEFGRISSTVALQIQSVVHRVWIQVGEKGTEAAAATGITFMPTSAVQPTFRVAIDRPFLFLVRDRATGAVLFLGRVQNPLQTGG
jgi:serpin B